MKKGFLFALITLSQVGFLGADQTGSEKAIASSTSSVALPALTLKECFQMALTQNESLKNRWEDIEQAKARARSALGNAFPHVAWNFSDVIQDSNTNLSSNTTNGNLIRKSTSMSKFSVSQPLFSGLREFSAMSGFKKEASRDEFSLRRATVNLFGSVAEAFYGVVASEMNLNTTERALKVSEDRVKELTERVKLGKSRDSESLTAQAQVATIKAQKSKIEGDMKIQRELLSFLIGQDASHSPLVDEISFPPSVLPLDQALRKIDQRSDVVAQREDVEAKQLLVRYQKGSYWPNMDLNGNYYTQRSGVQNGIDWDLLFTLEVPIYQGGTVSANVREAKSQYRQSKTNLGFLMRQAESEIKQAHISVESALDESRAWEEAYAATEKSYRLQVKEYRLGLVNNLDVIQVLNVLVEEKKNWDESTVRSKINYLKLLVATEDAPKE